MKESSTLFIESQKPQAQKKRGRPPKSQVLDAIYLIKPEKTTAKVSEKVIGRKRGRPKKEPTDEYVQKPQPPQ